MRNKRTLTIAAIIVACAAIVTVAVFRDTQTVQAQDQQPPPVNDRISFGMVGITAGQTMRVNVTSLLPPPVGDLPPGPTRVVMTFRGMNGQLIRNRQGEIIRRAVDLQRGESTFLDLNYDDLPPSPIRAQLRGVVNIRYAEGTVLPADVAEHKPMVSSMEVINNANGRTDWINASLAMNYMRKSGEICETCD